MNLELCKIAVPPGDHQQSGTLEKMTMLAHEVRKMAISNIIGNLAGHAGITYWIKHDLEGIAAGGVDGYIGDFLVTGFLFPAILAVIFIFMYRSKSAKGEVDRREIPVRHSKWLPVNAWMAGLVIGLAGFVSAILPLGAFLVTVGPSPLSPLVVSLTKGVWAAIAAGIIVPVAIHHGVRTGTAEPG